MPYLACSSESTEGFCPYVDTSCSAVNTCRTCNTFSDNGGECVELDYFPNATVAEYGEVGDGFFSMFDDPEQRAHKIKAEIYARVSEGTFCCTHLIESMFYVAMLHCFIILMRCPFFLFISIFRDLSPQPSMLTRSEITKAASSMTPPPPLTPTTSSPSSVLAKTQTPTSRTGSSETPGENTGAKWAWPELSWGRI